MTDCVHSWQNAKSAARPSRSATPTNFGDRGFDRGGLRTHRRAKPALVVLDEIAGYPKGFACSASRPASRVRSMAIALGLAPRHARGDGDRAPRAASPAKNAPPILPTEVATGPVDGEHHARQRGRSVQVPGPQVAAADGRAGRIGTGCTFLNRDPESGYVNVGTYRMQVHRRNLLGTLAEPRAARPADRGALLEAGQGLPGGGRPSAAIRCCSFCPTPSFRSASPSSIAPAACSGARSR